MEKVQLSNVKSALKYLRLKAPQSRKLNSRRTKPKSKIFAIDKMVRGKFEIQIDKKITDESFMEYCLNLKASGYDPSLLIGVYALGKSWHFKKLLFLQTLLQEVRNR